MKITNKKLALTACCTILFATGVVVYYCCFQPDATTNQPEELANIKNWSQPTQSAPKPTMAEKNRLKSLSKVQPKSVEHTLLELRQTINKRPVKGIRQAGAMLRSIAEKGEQLSPSDRSLATNLISELNHQCQNKKSLLARLVLAESASLNAEFKQIASSLKGTGQ